MEMAKKNQRYTVQDYMTWDDDERWELIDGIAYNMSPAPGIRHQVVSRNLIGLLYPKLSGNPCQLFHAPTDVILSKEDVVQPDVFIVCDSGKITDKNIQGAPDIIFEILSPSTSTKDKREKKCLYERSKVNEYILLDPVNNYAEYCQLNPNGIYGNPKIFSAQESILLKTLYNFEILLNEVFGVEKKTEE